MKSYRVALLCALSLGVSACCAVDVLPEKDRSPHFVATTKHLDLGGTVFLYADVDGDLKKITDFVSQAFDDLRKEDPDPDLARIDIPKLVGLLGFNKLEAVGLSSVRRGELFHNRAFLYQTAPKEGFMRLLGTKAHPFETPGWAPADADLVFEQDYNLHDAADVIEAMIKSVMGPGAEEVMAELRSPLPGMHVTLQQILDKLDTRLVGVLRIHDDRLIRLPHDDVEFPYTELALGVDGLGFLFDDLVETIGAMPMIKVSAEKDFQSIQSTQPLPGELAVYQPVLAKDVKTGRVYLATSLALLREFKPGPKALGQSAAFAQATRGLPKAGNGLTYISGQLVGEIMGWLTKLGQQSKELADMLGLIGALLPPRGVPMAGCNGALPDGIFVASNSNTSHKTTILLMGYANPFLIGVLAAVAVPAFTSYRDRAQAAAIRVEAAPPAAVPPAPVPPQPAAETPKAPEAPKAQPAGK